ncbi:MAG: GNAT family N-acetyltransferase [Synergistaceae bacterium]|nr:GNAT family N-acetyltransferase [Synergistaceae bacterium]
MKRKNNMEIRRFLETDNIDDVSRVYAKSWKSAYCGIVPQDYLDSIPENRWSKILINELSNLWIVSDGKQIIGSSTYALARDEKYSGWGEIISIYLLPSYFHLGIGTKLLRASMNELFSMGYENIYLWVLEDNFSARRFYEKNGFKMKEDTMQSVIGGKLLNEIRYIYNKNK